MKWSKYIIYGALILFSTSTLGQEHKAMFVAGEDFKGVIFDSLLSSKQALSPNLELYNLTKRDICQAEAILQTFFKENDKRKYTCCIIFPLRYYYRQYYGFHRDSDIIIRINFISRRFIKKNKALLNTVIIDIDDGGRTQFNMEINLSKGYILLIDSNAKGGSIYERG